VSFHGRHFLRHHPPPGLAFGKFDDRLQRMIQYSEASVNPLDVAVYWMPACSGMTA
jgi:hypothetical protein